MENILLKIGIFVFFLVLISLQYTLNKVFVVLKKIEVNTRGGRIDHDEFNH
ncbi:MAG: hypothetical protein JXR88_10325 [Clostridia bacterium]|nr:hypothetical protein [Clostridia bacterium]